MMKTGHCPKCQSTEIYRGTPLAGDGKIHFAAFPVTQMVTLYTEAFVCARCGYFETYVADGDKGKLGALAQDPKYWHKVT